MIDHFIHWIQIFGIHWIQIFGYLILIINLQAV